MTRKDSISNKTLGETLLYFVNSVALRTNSKKYKAQKSVLRDVSTHIHTTLFTGNTDDASSALTLAEKFSGMSGDGTIDWDSHDFLNACATLCREYYETIYHLHNEETDTFDF